SSWLLTNWSKVRILHDPPSRTPLENAKLTNIHLQSIRFNIQANLANTFLLLSHRPIANVSILLNIG
ncbi:hypothetical protein, partial [Shewanella algae]|uniref:hypothetical protein n=1 Tax=Shewanella algae TaxID=38313 RepID=UPI0030053E56